MKQTSAEGALLRGAVVPTAIIGAVGMGVSALLAGLPGFYGAALAQFVVVIFFAITIGVSKISNNLDPISTMGLALFSYTTKVFVLGLFLWLLTTFTSPASINRTSFGIVAIVLTLSWLGGEIFSFIKLRIPSTASETPSGAKQISKTDSVKEES